ncbi:uncharacterized protein ACO6RY_02147 [Pungitius sinensis]
MKQELNVAPPKATVNKAVLLLLALQTAYQTAPDLKPITTSAALRDSPERMIVAHSLPLWRRGIVALMSETYAASVASPQQARPVARSAHIGVSLQIQCKC